MAAQMIYLSFQEDAMEILEELIREENRRIRMLRMLSDLLVQVLGSRRFAPTEADMMISGMRKLALNLFPGKEQTFDLIYMPSFRRALREAGYYDARELRLLQGGKSE
jgi:hypothetical protein